MNKRDFYKALMSEYSFDKDSIRSNAKKGVGARHKLLPLYIGSAAAAVAAVVVGAALLIPRGDNGVSLIQEGTLAALTDSERIVRAMEEIRRNEQSSELVNVLVTFTEPLKPVQAKSVFAACSLEEIKIRQFYLTDGTRVVGDDDISALLSANEDEVSGAVVSCAGALMLELQLNNAVFTVEPVEEGDLETALPITVSDENAVVIREEMPNGDKPPVSTTEKPITTTTTTTENNIDPDPDDTFYIDGFVSPADIADTSDSDVYTAPSEFIEIDGVKLPLNVGEFSVVAEEVGVKTAFFLTDNTYFVMTDRAVKLYAFDGAQSTLLQEKSCPDGVVIFASESGGKVIAAGLDDKGRRNSLLLIDAENGSITDLRADIIAENGAIICAGYNEREDILALAVQEGKDKYSVCAAGLVGSTIATPLTCDSRPMLLGAGGGKIYAAVTEGNITRIYALPANGGDKTLVAELNGSIEAKTNLAFTRAVITSEAGASMIFDTATETLIDCGFSSVVFGAGADIFRADGGYYEIVGGEFAPVSGIDAVRAVDYKRSKSAHYAAYAGGGTVTIKRSAYSPALIANEPLIAVIAESCSYDIRGAINGAIGVVNALVDLEGCGIEGGEALAAIIAEFYSDSAAAELMQHISESNDRSAINIADTAVVISDSDGSSATGTLYIRVGTYDGRPGWRSVEIRLTNENEVWKLDSILS